MKGIVRTAVQLLYGSGLQRWLTVIGLMLTLFCIAALLGGWHANAQFLFFLIGMLGIAITAISPIVVGAVVFRGMSAPRCVQLIRHGRLKLALGALSTQLALALFIAVTTSALLLAAPSVNPSHTGNSATGLIATTLAQVFSALTLYFLSFYLSMQYRLGAFLWVSCLFVPGLFSHAFPQAHLGALLLTSRGLIAVLSISILAWSVFVLGFVRQRHIHLPNWKLVGPASAAPRRSPARNTRISAITHYGSRQAMRIQLTGVANIERQCFLIILIILLAFLAAGFLTRRAATPGRDEGAFVAAFLICMGASIAQAIRPGIMTRRAKFLWLQARMNRAELFAATEMQSWCLVLPVLGTAMALALAFLAFTNHAMPPPARLVVILGVPLVTATWGIYISLLLVRGFRRTDTVFMVAYTVLLMVEIGLSVVGPPASPLPLLLGAQIILLPVLRHIAQRRWQNIDWLIHKNPLAAQLTG